MQLSETITVDIGMVYRLWLLDERHMADPIGQYNEHFSF